MTLDPQTGAALAAFLIYIINETAKYGKKYFENKGKFFSKSVEYVKQIKQIIVEIRSRLEADRAFIMEFTNTEKSLSNVPYKYFSFNYENDEENTTEINKHFQKIPISNQIELISMLNDDNVRFKIINDYDDHLSESISTYLDQYGIKTMVLFKLSANRLCDGILRIHFVKEHYNDKEGKIKDLNREDSEYLKTQAIRIVQLLTKIK